MKKVPQRKVCKKPIAGRFFAGLMGCLVSLSVFAAETVPSPLLSMSDVLTLTMNNHADLKALVKQQDVLQGRIRQAATAQRPQIGLMMEDAMGSGDYSGLKSMQTTLTFSWLLEQAQIDSRVKAIESEADQLLLDKQIRALDLAALAARQFIEVLIKTERLTLNKLAVEQAKDVLSAINERIAAGKGSEIERKLGEAELVRRELAVEDLTHDIQASKYQLSALWGQPDTHLRLSGDLLDLPVIPAAQPYVDALKRNPSVQRFATAQRIAQSQIERARIEARPQWQLSAGLRRYETTDDFGFVAGITIPWGNADYNAGTIAALQAQQEVLNSQQASLMQQLDAQLYVLLQEMKHSMHVIETVDTRIVPTLESALSEARKAFELGQLSYNQWSDVRHELLSAQSQLLDAYQSLHLQHIEIQRLTGTSLSQ
ncbi:TolC family protein [Alteromonas alba]|uniref:TolC family protein n=1 Tax=Alteromonas alba TaxID=2079529 RepID=A0A2S9VED7_9ALTE|nr:TolC family protein [Alteromonas alba]PRO74665.1 TolC family protein [Alteromonas alba]